MRSNSQRKDRIPLKSGSGKSTDFGVLCFSFPSYSPGLRIGLFSSGLLPASIARETELTLGVSRVQTRKTGSPFVTLFGMFSLFREPLKWAKWELLC